jgi:hypothetical protein
MSGGKERVQVVLDESSAAIIVRGGIKVHFNTGGGIEVYGDVPVTLHPAANDDADAQATPRIGVIESTGEHKGEIYGGIYPADNKPIWFSAAPGLMSHYNAAAWASEQGGALPTREHGDYLTTLRNKGGAFMEIFNRSSSFPAALVWLAEPYTFGTQFAWCQRLSDGGQHLYDRRNDELPVLCVRR